MRLMLKPNPEQSVLLAETTQQFTAVFNAACAHGYERGEKNGVTLHHALYRRLKTEYPALVSDHHIQARVKATEAVKSALTLAHKGWRVAVPRSASCPPRYNLHTFRLDWARGEATLSTVNGRQRIPFTVPAYAAKYAGGRVTTADLICRSGSGDRTPEGHWFLHVVVDVPTPEIAPIDAVVGVDLGLAQPAVTSDAVFLGRKRWRNVEHRRFKLRRALQSKGTKSAKRHLKKMGRKQRRFRRDCDHVLSKRIAQSVPPGATIVAENLANIRSRIKTKKGRQARRIHGWSFDQCRRFIQYKAEERGCTVAGVDPRHTSQQCSRCGHTARTNRRSRALFVCRACGYRLHADLNGARNIAARYRAGSGTPAPGGPPVNRPIVGEDHPGVPSAHKLPDLSGRH
jgi:putative transposase